MTRGPLALAALASAAVPGLDPTSVEGVVTDAAHPFDVAFVQDVEHRRWVVRCPRTPAAAAQLEQSAALLSLLARRLTVPVPSVKGWVALPEGGRAAVHGYVTGQPVDLDLLAPGSRLTAGIGRALGQLHNLDVAVYEEAGVPVYDAEAYRTRRLADLDRAAATGRVPTGLLSRWEATLEDVSRWRFTAVPTHGAVQGESMLATPGDDGDAELKALVAWESAQVADPADDLAALVGALDAATLDTVLEAYAHVRVQRPDPHLVERARLVDEMRLVRSMTTAVAAGDDAAAEDYAAQLRRLDQEVAQEEEQEAATRQEGHATADLTGVLPLQRTGSSAAADPSDEDDAREAADDSAVETENPVEDEESPASQTSASRSADEANQLDGEPSDDGDPADADASEADTPPSSGGSSAAR